MTTRIIAPVLALAALTSAQTAQAQQQACVAQKDLSDAVVYAMPIAYDAARTACANRFTKSGFIATRGDAFIGTFRAAQDKSWPGAFRMLKVFMADEGTGEDGASASDMAPMLEGLPEEALRPFVDAMVGQEIAKQIKGDSCAKIERGVELLSPLPTDNVGGLVAFVADLADIKSPAICAAAPAMAKK